MSYTTSATFGSLNLKYKNDSIYCDRYITITFTSNQNGLYVRAFLFIPESSEITGSGIYFKRHEPSFIDGNWFNCEVCFVSSISGKTLHINSTHDIDFSYLLKSHAFDLTVDTYPINNVVNDINCVYETILHARMIPVNTTNSLEFSQTITDTNLSKYTYESIIHIHKSSFINSDTLFYGTVSSIVGNQINFITNDVVKSGTSNCDLFLNSYASGEFPTTNTHANYVVKSDFGNHVIKNNRLEYLVEKTISKDSKYLFVINDDFESNEKLCIKCELPPLKYFLLKHNDFIVYESNDLVGGCYVFEINNATLNDGVNNFTIHTNTDSYVAYDISDKVSFYKVDNTTFNSDIVPSPKLLNVEEFANTYKITYSLPSVHEFKMILDGSYVIDSVNLLNEYSFTVPKTVVTKNNIKAILSIKQLPSDDATLMLAEPLVLSYYVDKVNETYQKTKVTGFFFKNQLIKFITLNSLSIKEFYIQDYDLYEKVDNSRFIATVPDNTYIVHIPSKTKEITESTKFFINGKQQILKTIKTNPFTQALGYDFFNVKQSNLLPTLSISFDNGSYYIHVNLTGNVRYKINPTDDFIQYTGKIKYTGFETLTIKKNDDTEITPFAIICSNNDFVNNVSAFAYLNSPSQTSYDYGFFEINVVNTSNSRYAYIEQKYDGYFGEMKFAIGESQISFTLGGIYSKITNDNEVINSTSLISGNKQPAALVGSYNDYNVYSNENNTINYIKYKQSTETFIVLHSKSNSSFTQNELNDVSYGELIYVKPNEYGSVNFDLQSTYVIEFDYGLYSSVVPVDNIIVFSIPDYSNISWYRLVKISEFGVQKSQKLTLNILARNITLNNNSFEKSNSLYSSSNQSSPIYAKDLSYSGNGLISDESSSVQNVLSILLTNPGERLMFPKYGVGIRNLIFRLRSMSNDLFRDTILDALESQMRIYTPETKLIKDECEFIYLNNEDMVFQITIMVRSGSVKQVGLTLKR